MTFDSTGTKAFTAESESGYPGSFPKGFLRWVREQGWWGEKRIYLCAGGVIDDAADKVDIQKEIDLSKLSGRKGKHPTLRRTRIVKTTANIIADARDTGLAASSYDWVMIDPPYDATLAKNLYGTEEVFSGINAFIKEGLRLCKPGGYVLSFTYAIPRYVEGAEIVGVWGIYQIPAVRHMTALFVYKKDGERRAQFLEKWGINPQSEECE